ncbi:hypothetical protein Leryth_025659 [Lithospermum erythrorhizon]|nr:hypothetical protein Leryth_025659 [Lithospermum erythrorhizon]
MFSAAQKAPPHPRFIPLCSGRWLASDKTQTTSLGQGPRLISDSTVWDKLVNKFNLSRAMFSAIRIQHKYTPGGREMKSKSPSPKKHVLEPKRLQNITILSKALNMTSEQVCDALIKGTPKVSWIF